MPHERSKQTKAAWSPNLTHVSMTSDFYGLTRLSIHAFLAFDFRNTFVMRLRLDVVSLDDHTTPRPSFQPRKKF